jgi:hypothetical protein
MGTWDVGPFNNDTAADWCGDLHDAAGDQRLPLLRATLSAIVDNTDKRLSNRLADRAIAAVAVVASQLLGGEPLVTPYAPDFLLEGGTLDIPGDIPPLALLASDRIVGTTRSGETCGKTPAAMRMRWGHCGPSVPLWR